MSAIAFSFEVPGNSNGRVDRTNLCRKIRLPAEWNELFAGRAGRVCLTRKFHRPTNLGPNEQVDLVFEQWPGVWVVSLNQHCVGELRDASAESPERITITASLESTNELAAETQIEQPGDALLPPRTHGQNRPRDPERRRIANQMRYADGASFAYVDVQPSAERTTDKSPARPARSIGSR